MPQERAAIARWAGPLLACSLLVAVSDQAHGEATAADKLRRQTGTYYTLTADRHPDGVLTHLTLEYHKLLHRAAWCGIQIDLTDASGENEPIDLSGENRLVLSFSTPEVGVRVRIELKDARSPSTQHYLAYQRVDLPAGRESAVVLTRAGVLAGLSPLDGWQRVALWPDWSAIRHVVVVVEAKNNEATEGVVQLQGMEYGPAEGRVASLRILVGSIHSFEYTPAGTPGTRAEAQPAARRDDPTSVLFASGGGFKPTAALPFLGVSGRAFAREDPKRADDLLITALDKDLSTDEARRGVLERPVFTRGGSVSAILDIPGEESAGWPRLTFTHGETEILHSLESRFPTVRDLQETTDEVAALWSSPYLASGRFFLVVEPLFRTIRRDTSGTDPGPREDAYVALVNISLHDVPGNREWFVQASYGRGRHLNFDLDPVEKGFRVEFRQWFGAERPAYAALGVTRSDVDYVVEEDGLPDDYFRPTEVYGLVIADLDEQGWWRGSLRASHFTTEARITSFPPGLGLVKRETEIEFWDVEARLIREIIPDIDVSLGVRTSLADTDDFDSITLEGVVSVFDRGPWRLEVGARETWYPHVDEELDSLFIEVNFAR